jgi:hypothetical protein
MYLLPGSKSPTGITVIIENVTPLNDFQSKLVLPS